MGGTADFDVVVAGGGVAGSVAAAALAAEGLSVLMVEPGQRQERRLAGELVHPAGVRGLEALGFALHGPEQGAVPIRGFAVFHDRGAAQPPSLLPYGDGAGQPNEALALEHGTLRACLGAQAAAMPGVAVLEDARVTGLDLASAERPVVTLRRGGRESSVRARLVVAADGASSQARTLAGIGHRRRRLSTIMGFVLNRHALPAPGYGHVFLGAGAPVLAYEIGPCHARLLVDLPLDGRADRHGASLHDTLSALPSDLRAEVEQAATTQALRHAGQDVAVDAAVRGRVVLVGDAGGSCHPLTATGMTVAINDALTLRAALRDQPGDLDAALALYGRRRRRTQRTRRMLAASLYEAWSGSEPELMVIKRGLERYWREDARGRAASMALLAMSDLRLLSALREMVAVILHGLARDDRSGGARALPLLDQLHLGFGLSRLLVRHMTQVMQVR